MSQTLIDELHRENLCTHFILPLLKLQGKVSFLSSNFVNSYIGVRDGNVVNTIVVKVLEPALVMSEVFRHPQFRYVGRDLEYFYLVFEIPAHWERDLNKFMEGKFSQMSEKAKEMIRRYSGLPYREVQGDATITDARLMALDKNEALKDMWERALDVYLNDMDLLSIPDKRSVIDLETLEPVMKS
jgi:hypothetical protein